MSGCALKKLPRFGLLRNLSPGFPRKKVWLAEDHLRQELPIVLKKISLPRPLNEANDNLATQIDNYVSLAHPYLAKTSGICPGNAPGTYWLVTEFISGVPFFPQIRSLSQDSLLEILAQFCSVLHYIHSHGFIHLDLHPNNVMLVPPSTDKQSWTLKLIDLPLLPADTLLIHRDTAVFNTTYSAPEVVEGQPFDSRSDLYSLGVLFYQGIVGELPPSDTENSLSATSTSPDLTFNADLISPRFLAPIIQKLLARNRDRRFSSSFFLLEDINSSLKEKQLAPTTARDHVLMAASVPFLQTPAFARAMSAINNWRNRKPFSPLHHLEIVGPPGSGKERLASALGLRMTVAGWKQLYLSPSSDSPNIIFHNQIEDDSIDTEPSDRIQIPQGEFVIVNNDSYKKPLPHFDDPTGGPILIISRTNAPFLQHSQASLLPPNKDCSEIQTGPLDEQQSLLLIKRILLSECIPHHHKKLIAEKGLQLPGLIHDIISEHISEGRLRKHGAFWNLLSADSTSAPLPASAITRMQPLISRMPLVEISILQLLSLSDFPLHPQFIEEVCGLSCLALRDPIVRLISSGFVKQSASGISIASPSIGEIARSLLSDRDDRQLCQRALTRLAPLAVSKPSELDAALVAYASYLGDTQHIIKHALRAAIHFESLAQTQSAVPFYRMALSSLDSGDTARKSHILERLLTLLEKMGNQNEFSRHSTVLQELLPQLPDLQQMRLFKMLANHYSNLLDVSQSMRFAMRALRIARRVADHAEHANCMDILAQNQLRLGRPFTALRIAKQSITLRTRHNLNSETGPSIGFMAGAYYMEGDYARALTCARQAIKYSRPGRELTRLPLSLNNLGILLMEKGDLIAARRSFRRCLAMSTVSRDLFGMSTAHGNLAVCEFYSGDILGMKRHSDRFSQLLSESGSHYGYQQSLLTLAEAQCVRGQVNDSLISLATAQAASRENGDTLNELLSALQTGWVHLALGNHQDAFSHLHRLQQPLLRAGFRVHQASCSLGLAAIEIALGQYESARLRLDSILGKLPHQHMVSELQFHIIRGRLHLSEGKLAGAQRDFTFAATLARRHGFRPYAFESWLALAQCALKAGDLDEARKLLRRLVGLNRHLKYRLLEPWLHVALSDYAAASGNSWEHNRHLLNGRTCLLELSHNIHDAKLRNSFLNRPESQLLLQRSEDVEELLNSGLARPTESSIPSTALESIARINEQLHGRDSLKSTLGLIIDEALQLSGAERGILFLFDPTGREELKIARNLHHRSLVEARKYTRTALRQIRAGETVYAADTLTDPQFSTAESITHHHIRSVACVPLRSRHSIIGALYLDSHRIGLSSNPSLLKSLQIFAQQAAAALERSIRYFHVTQENRRLRESARLDRSNLIGHGGYFTRLKQLIAAAGMSDLPVLILGESGTGKELVARSIHETGKTRLEPFLSVDCGALPANLVESELFGYLRGAFTGADRDKEGLFVAARNGTLFLDEIANTSLALQAKLLRALQEREIRPLGSTVPIPFQARILAATNGDLRKEAREGRFRQDLLFRLNGLSIEMPPLRDRKGDISLLIAHFLQKLSTRSGHRVQQVSDEALQALMRYDWPGNVRELENSIERAVVLARAGTIRLEDLPDMIRSSAIVTWSEKKGEQRLVEEALRRFGGDKTRAAADIGWNRQKLYRKMTQYNIPRDFGRRNTA